MKNILPYLDPNFFRGQFILSAENYPAPKGWANYKYLDWNLYTADLPVIDVYNEEKIWMGWCIGHPIVDGILEPETIIITKSDNEQDPFEDFYNRTSGKWILILLSIEEEKIYISPLGSLSIVYSLIEKTLASTPTLIGLDSDWDNNLMTELNFPEKLEWLPFGLTFKKNVRRLMPNHTLNLKEWKVTRHWPTPETDLSMLNDTSFAVQQIVKNVTTSINAITDKHQICLTLTAGRDSRSVLACSRKEINKTLVVTFAPEKETVEMNIAKRIAKKNNLNHQFLKIPKATPEEKQSWLYLTGFSGSGAICKIHKVIEKLDPNMVLIPGTSAELHKGNY
ncbi:MAG: hypothetical protein M3421_02415, partial [Bacteroidota bacterium]|nr:hypothetical protein [Bacteroidota bacterium]